jgi:hypothetical protein
MVHKFQESSNSVQPLQMAFQLQTGAPVAAAITVRDACSLLFQGPRVFCGEYWSINKTGDIHGIVIIA